MLEHVLNDVLCLLQHMDSELLSEVELQLRNDLLILGMFLVISDEVRIPEHHQQGVQEVAGSR